MTDRRNIFRASSDMEIVVVTHKPVRFNLPEYYHWIQVNAEKNGPWENFLHDNENNDNISGKNNSYCELTALYTLWKNSNADIKGLCHYRRFLGNGLPFFHLMRHGLFLSKERILSEVIKKNRIARLLNKNDILLSAPIYPYPTTAHEDLLRFVYLKDINTMIDVVEEFYPEYVPAFWDVLSSTNIHYCNMFIASKEVTDAYCSWLFSMLDKIEAKIDLSSYDPQHQRLFGYLAEVLLNVYIRHHGLKAKDLEQIRLDEEMHSSPLKKELLIIRNSVYSLFKQAPPKNNQMELWRARIRHYNSRKTIPIKINTTKERKEYFERIGGTILSVGHEEWGGNLTVQFSEVIVHAYFAENMEAFFKIAASIKPIQSEFSCAVINRIYCSFPLEQSFVRKYAKEGLFLYSSN